MPLRQRLSRVLRPLVGAGPPPGPVRQLTLADVAIIVLHWNKRDVTLRCLDSLAAAELGGATVWVVDNGSRDGSLEAIQTQRPDVRLVGLPENRGYAGGNNAGTRAALDAGAGAVLLLNNDTEVAHDFLDPLIEVLKATRARRRCRAPSCGSTRPRCCRRRGATCTTGSGSPATWA
jgi:glycosyltransferase involved in cell wall biosynthesis